MRSSTSPNTMPYTRTNSQAATLVVVVLLGYSYLTLVSGNAIVTNGDIEDLWSRVDWKKEISSPINNGEDDTWNIRKGDVPRRFLAEETDEEFYRPVVKQCGSVVKFDVLVKGDDAKAVPGYLRKMITSDANIHKDNVEMKIKEKKDKKGDDIPDAKCARRYDKDTTRITFLVTTTESQATEKVEKLVSLMKKKDFLAANLRSQGSLRICGAALSKSNTRTVCQKKEEEPKEEEEEELDDFEQRALEWLKSLLASGRPLP